MRQLRLCVRGVGGGSDRRAKGRVFSSDPAIRKAHQIGDWFFRKDLLQLFDFERFIVDHQDSIWARGALADTGYMTRAKAARRRASLEAPARSDACGTAVCRWFFAGVLAPFAWCQVSTPRATRATHHGVGQAMRARDHFDGSKPRTNSLIGQRCNFRFNFMTKMSASIAMFRSSYFALCAR